MTKRFATLTTLGAALCLSGLLTQSAMAAATVATDLGVAPDTDSKDIMISLALPDMAAARAFVASTIDPKSPNFHKFLKPEEFAARFGQSQAVIDRVTTNLASQGITVTKVYGNKLVLAAHGSNARLAAAFNAPIHTFATDSGSFQKPVGRASIPAVLQDVVTHVTGLSTEPVYHPHLRMVPAEATSLALAADQLAAADLTAAATAPVAGTPGTYSVNDLAKQNNITPLYAQGVTGAGTTLGIMTFATFKTADVGTYWAWAGLSSDTSRITTINVGTGQSASGADETTLDVEQAGGVAPGANIRVYVAANSEAGALALYTQAITENKCDSLSISWGQAEVYYDGEVDLPPYEALFLQAAAQGTPITASSGDEASYDLNYSLAYPYPNYNTVLTVDYPSSSPYVVAAGGTTLPVTLKLSKGTIINPTERPWAWDYLRSYITANSSLAAYYANDFPVGGGGGVSVQFPVPDYQQGLPGVVTSAAGQTMFCFTSPKRGAGIPCTPGTRIVTLPAGYAGRNTPDVSMNADPETGYALFYNNKWSVGGGGTSFVAPQLNGIFALMTQKLGTRVGWPHPQMYSLFRTMGHGPASPFKAITSGDNLYYAASPNYNPAVGLGALDVGNLAAAWKAPATAH